MENIIFISKNNILIKNFAFVNSQLIINRGSMKDK